MDHEEYAQIPGLNCHALMDFMKSPMYYKAKYIDKGIIEKDSDSLRLGRAVHCAVLEGVQKFDGRFIVVPLEFMTPSGAISTKKAAQVWCRCNPDHVSPSELHTIDAIVEAVMAHHKASDLLKGCEVEKLGIGSIAGMDVKGRADADGGWYGVDLKTTSSMESFEQDALRYRYDVQAAFYSMLFGWDEFFIIAVTKESPVDVRVFKFDDDTIAEASRSIGAAIQELRDCQSTNTWAYDDVQIISRRNHAH